MQIYCKPCYAVANMILIQRGSKYQHISVLLKQSAGCTVMRSISTGQVLHSLSHAGRLCRNGQADGLNTLAYFLRRLCSVTLKLAWKMQILING